MMKLTVVRNKANGQVTMIIPKSVAELHGLNEKIEAYLEPKGKDEFVLRVKR